MTGISQLQCCYDNSVAISTRESHIESIFGMEVPWHDRHQPATSLLWLLSYHSNQGKTLITPFSSVVLSQYLVWRFLGTTGISQLPRCYGNSVAMATRPKPNK